MSETVPPQRNTITGFILEENSDWMAIPAGMIPEHAHFYSGNGNLLVSVKNWTQKAEDEIHFDVYSLSDAEKRLHGTRNLLAGGADDDITDWWFYGEDPRPIKEALRQDGKFVAVRDRVQAAGVGIGLESHKSHWRT